MTIGGTGSGGAGYLDDVELTSLDPDSSPVPDCLSSLSPLPMKLAGSAGALEHSSKLTSWTIHASGHSERLSDATIQVASLLFVAARMEKMVRTKPTPATSMILSGMLGQRLAEQCLSRETLPGSTVQVVILNLNPFLTRCDHFACPLEQWGLVLAGDKTGAPRNISNVETTSQGLTFEALPDLPRNNSYSCVAIIDDDRLFASGGMDFPSEALIFSKSQQLWMRYLIITTIDKSLDFESDGRCKFKRDTDASREKRK